MLPTDGHKIMFLEVILIDYKAEDQLTLNIQLSKMYFNKTLSVIPILELNGVQAVKT